MTRSLIRLYHPSDLEAVKRIFSEQNLDVFLPVPYDRTTGQGDPAVNVALVSEENGEVRRALIARVGIEAHWITASDDIQSYTLNRLASMSEGAALENGRELFRLGFPVPTTVRARVPKRMVQMLEYMRDRLGFIDESTEFVGLNKRLGA